MNLLGGRPFEPLPKHSQVGGRISGGFQVRTEGRPFTQGIKNAARRIHEQDVFIVLRGNELLKKKMLRLVNGAVGASVNWHPAARVYLRRGTPAAPAPGT